MWLDAVQERENMVTNLIMGLIEETENNLERIKFTGDSPTSNNSSFFTSSIHDNAFVSHMIPRTDNQLRWVSGSLDREIIS